MGYISSDVGPAAKQPPGSRPLFVYYGSSCGELMPFAGRLALQPDHVEAGQLDRLSACGGEALAYLSLGEDTGPEGPWQRPQRNVDWGGSYVRVGHPDWRKQVVQRAKSYLRQGFAGLLLDTLDAVQIFPEDRDAMLRLVRQIRRACPHAYLLANRGFDLLPEVVPHLDGILFEGFTAIWTAQGYQSLPADSLELNSRIGSYLQTTGLDLYALDYADDPALIEFARQRARCHNMYPLTSNRNLTLLPEGRP